MFRVCYSIRFVSIFLLFFFQFCRHNYFLYFARDSIIFSAKMNDFLTHFVCYKYGNNELLRFKNICIRFVRLRASTCGTVMVFRCCLLLLLLLVNGCCGTKCKKKKTKNTLKKYQQQTK